MNSSLEKPQGSHNVAHASTRPGHSGIPREKLKELSRSLTREGLRRFPGGSAAWWAPKLPSSVAFTNKARAAAAPPPGLSPGLTTDHLPPRALAQGPQLASISTPRAPPRLFGWSGESKPHQLPRSRGAPPSVSLPGRNSGAQAPSPGIPGGHRREHARGRSGAFAAACLKPPEIGLRTLPISPTRPRLHRPRHNLGTSNRPRSFPTAAACSATSLLARLPASAGGWTGRGSRTRGGGCPIANPVAAAQSAHEERWRLPRAQPTALCPACRRRRLQQPWKPTARSPEGLSPDSALSPPFYLRRPGTPQFRRARGRFWEWECKQIGVL